jgi:Site-specific recombinases, DNA invertase Pin homologs
MRKAVAYYRVSTERQGQSGLGLDAQKKSVTDFSNANSYVLDYEFIEIETGKRNNRPVLAEALAWCKEKEATLLIAKLDRLGRNLRFITAIQESGVDFTAVDNPNAGKFMVHIMAAVAEYERDQISERTTAALQAAKARGIRLGVYGRDVLSMQNKRQAIAFAISMKPVIETLQSNGFNTIRRIADELNRLNIPTYHKAKWYPTTVYQLIKRLQTE